MNFVRLGLFQPYINYINLVGFIDRVHFVQTNFD